MLHSTSAFIDSNDVNREIRGYSALLCEWLTELFDTPFVLKHTTWSELFEGFEDGSIDFTGNMTPTEERQYIFYMTDPIAQRSIRYFRLTDYEEVDSRLPRYALLEGAASSANILKYKLYDFEPVFVSEYMEAHDLLVAGEIDALLAENSAEALFDRFNDVVTSPFFPLLYTPVSLTAKNPELEPIITVIQRFLENGGKHFLDELFDEGYREYYKHKLYMQLTDQEKDFIRNSGTIPFGAEYANYPISFYNERYDEWQGIAFDVLEEVSRLTGLEFEVYNDVNTQFYDLLEMLQDGRVHMVTEVIRTPEREGHYIWPENALMIDRSVLISKVTFPNISTNKVYSAKVGLSKGSAYTEFFFTWFPNHENYVIMHSQQATFDALVNGEVDMVMNSYSTLLNLINYQEMPDYKANILFENNYPATFGINKEQVILCGIIDKALALIDTEIISEHWKNRAYDYQLRLMQAQRPWIIGAAVLLLCVLILVAVLLVRSRYSSKKLENLVDERTRELELKERIIAANYEDARKARDEAEIANKFKSSFLANMSHEIRTPMNAILGITEILIQNEALPVDIEDGLCKIYSSCDMLLGIINDILDFSKIEAGKLDITPAPYSVASLINDAVQLNMMRIGSKQIEFKLIINEEIPAKLIGDELRIKQILNNLLSNAFKYTDSGMVTLSFDFKPIPGENKVLFEFVVRDSGQGMTPEQVEKLFDEYARFNNETNIRVQGTGLGLAITQRLISLMNGEIIVNSVYGVGSFFTVSFAQELVDESILGKDVADNLRYFRINNLTHSKICQTTRDLMPYGNVLVVDDVETNLYVASGLMKPYELHIDTVLSGYEAINRIKGGKVYDIVFMDHMMPVMDGIEATKRLREAGYNEPIIALSANAVAGQAEIFLKNGFTDFISKPIDVRQLNSILNKYIRDKQPAEVIEAVRLRGGGTEVSEPLSQLDSMLLEPFAKDGRKAITVIEELYKKNELESNEVDLRRFIVYVHGIKASLWNIGEKELSGIAARLEDEGREKNINEIMSLTPGFLNEMRALVERIEIILRSNNTGEDNGDYDLLYESLLAVKEMCADYNRKGALDLLADMNGYSNGVMTALNRIKAHILGGDFENAENEIALYITELPGKNKTKFSDKTVSGLDIKKGIEKYSGDEEVYLSILRSYTASMRSMLGTIESVTEENLKSYEIVVHGIKGTSRDMFAEEIGEAAAALEKAAKEGELRYIHEHNRAFLELTGEFVSELEALITIIDAENPKPAKDKPEREALLKLLEACKIYDMNSADETITELRSFSYEEDDDLVSWLGEKFDMTRFDDIVERLSKELI
jgi:signal transduction histidine kinase/CheY-like chemotaxis protein/HPt (histidine-containing phosphotransfer) domain-containing protein